MLCLPDSSSHESSGIVTGQRYLLKWSVPLGHVDVIEYGNNDGQGENCRFPPQHTSENIVVNAKPSKYQYIVVCLRLSNNYGYVNVYGYVKCLMRPGSEALRGPKSGPKTQGPNSVQYSRTGAVAVLSQAKGTHVHIP